MHSTNVHCLGEKNGRHQAPILPLLLAAEPAELPDNTSIPPPAVPQVRCEPESSPLQRFGSAVACGQSCSNRAVTA